MTGKVVAIVADKGFFFLAVEGEEADYFAHKDSLPKGIRVEHLKVGDEFVFDPNPLAAKGPRAENLRRPQRMTLDELIAKAEHD